MGPDPEFGQLINFDIFKNKIYSTLPVITKTYNDPFNKKIEEPEPNINIIRASTV